MGEILLLKLPEEYHEQFVREGLVDAVSFSSLLACLPPSCTRSVALSLPCELALLPRVV
jgi:hypothetical protein